MTRETKIGLLVGLAFIILFGIILSEKGTAPEQRTTFIAARTPPPLEMRTTEEHSDIIQPLAPTNDPRQGADIFPSPASDRRITPLPTDTRPGPASVENKPAETPSKLKDYLPPKAEKAIVQVPPANPSPVGGDSPPNVDMAKAAEDKVKGTEKAAFASHEVQSGETLAGICRQYYPGRAYTMIETVMKLNSISKPERLRAGETIKLPVEAAEGPTPIAAKSTPAGTTRLEQVTVNIPVTPADGTKGMFQPPSKELVRKVLPPAAMKVKTYVIQPNDTLSKIAKQFYGHESAWKQVYEFNRNSIQDPHHVRSGLEIRLPQLPVVEEVATGRTHPDY
jgi:nucleoid-associated protein YgaU